MAKNNSYDYSKLPFTGLGLIFGTAIGAGQSFVIAGDVMGKTHWDENKDDYKEKAADYKEKAMVMKDGVENKLKEKNKR